MTTLSLLEGTANEEGRGCVSSLRDQMESPWPLLGEVEVLGLLRTGVCPQPINPSQGDSGLPDPLRLQEAGDSTYVPISASWVIKWG